MKKVLLIGRKDAGEKNDVAQLAGALHVDFGFFEELVITIYDGSTDIFLRRDAQRLDVKSYEQIILIGWSHDKVYTDLAGAVAYFSNYHGIPVWNSELIDSRSMTKTSQMVRAALNGISVPDTVFSLDSDLLYDTASEQLKYPLVVKSVTASRGRKNFLVKSSSELKNMLNDNSSDKFICQKFIENDNYDYRILVSGGKVALAIKRIGEADSHLNNISAGAKAELLDLANLPKGVIKDSETVARIFKRELCGVDFIVDSSTKEHLFLEVNLTPQIVNGVFAKEKTEAITKTLEKS